MSGKYVFTQGLKELRFLFCQTSEASAATRSFLNRAYPTMKKHNPQTPIMMREAAGTQPRVFARYGTNSNCDNSIRKGEAGGFDWPYRHPDRRPHHPIGQAVINSFTSRIIFMSSPSRRFTSIFCTYR
ncbi:unnamed protein product [Penicillium salamii]|nr:unnamed protein product [Penicillium salamii]CAG8132687.1 unnamed protein product [Penicillium salamii]CAG8363638.1 unnamed protein product [Penicillium salamii]